MGGSTKQGLTCAVLGVVLIALLAGCSGWQASSETEAQTTYATIEEINGNEMVVQLGSYTEISQPSEDAQQTDESQTGTWPAAGSDAAGGQAMQGGGPGQTGEGMQAPTGSMPEMGGEMEAGGGQGSAQQTQGGMGSGMGGGFVSNGQTATYTIPVKTPVLYELNGETVKTTFARLAAGYVLQLTLQTNDAGQEVITEITIISQQSTTTATTGTTQNNGGEANGQQQGSSSAG
ncbi:MAG: hypothetical protein ACK5L3_00655 [Oscillospiraceae bacterium]